MCCPESCHGFLMLITANKLSAVSIKILCFFCTLKYISHLKFCNSSLFRAFSEFISLTKGYCLIIKLSQLQNCFQDNLHRIMKLLYIYSIYFIKNNESEND